MGSNPRLLASATLLIAGCSSSGSDPAVTPNQSTVPDNGTSPVAGSPSGNVTMWGFVNADEDNSSNEVELSAAFFQFVSGVSAETLSQSFKSNLDTCTVTTNQLSTPDGIQIPALPTVSTISNSISAGETIGFSNAGNTFAELTKGTEFGFIVYQNNLVTIPAPLPADLVMDIPGDVYPAFSAVPIPNTGPFTLTSPTTGQTITPATEFSWTPGAHPDAVVDISIQTIDIATSMSINVSCEAADDGSFAFPATTQTEMGAGFMTLPGFGVSAGRNLTTIVKQGDALLVIQSSSDD